MGASSVILVAVCYVSWMRITAQLIQVKDQTHLWSYDYDYRAKDVLNVEDDVAKAVARQIQLRLASQQLADLARSRQVNPEAFDAYMHGYYYLNETQTKIRTWRQSINERRSSLILPMRWLGSGCLGHATGRPTFLHDDPRFAAFLKKMNLPT